MTNKVKPDSPLVNAVLALDNHLAELERVGGKINSAEMTSDVDIEYIQKLMTRFAECGQGISDEVMNLSKHIQEAQARAETVAQGVSKQAELLNVRRNEENEKMEKFRILGEKVRDLNAVISQFKPAGGNPLTEENRVKLASNVPAFETQLAGLIEDLQNLRQSARSSRMRALEKNAESLAQSLEAVRKRLRDL